jgi:hypothetical protein
VPFGRSNLSLLSSYPASTRLKPFERVLKRVKRDGSGRPWGRSEDGGGRASCAQGRCVIGPTGTVRVMVATRPVDFRKGAEGLTALVREEMKADPFTGTVYVFRAK